MDRNWVMALHKQNQIFRHNCCAFEKKLLFDKCKMCNTVSQGLLLLRIPIENFTPNLHFNACTDSIYEMISLANWHRFPYICDALALIDVHNTNQKIIWDFVMIGWYFVPPKVILTTHRMMIRRLFKYDSLEKFPPWGSKTRRTIQFQRTVLSYGQSCWKRAWLCFFARI